MRFPSRILGALSVVCFGFIVPSTPAADHRESPALLASGAVGGRDINDVYIFESPANSDNTVLVMTTNPFAGALSPTFFDSAVDYELRIDKDGDAIADIVFRVEFGAPRRTGQSVSLRSTFSGANPPPTLPSASGRVGQDLPVAGGGTLRCDVFDDPFFFDANAFRDLVSDGVIGNDPSGISFGRNPGVNLFGPNANILAIVLEIPTDVLTRGATPCSPDDTTFGFWGVTLSGNTQVDRMGFPAIATALVHNIPSNRVGAARKNEFNASLPQNDAAQFRPDMIAIIRDFYLAATNPTLSLMDRETIATGLANFLLPDILPYDTTMASAFPNGRNLADDVIDAEFGLLTNGVVTSDNLPNDSTFRATFPYLGVPNANPAGPNPN